ncbi:hypothetical protein NQ176_g10763 [Zarea fungicola]|uniref:Uncharacterized protein n=1 Tax=Zarea fungicola TaxID=93591 RepID=A0ACC1MEP1_9HYPO|nr:hypothetical protein NQ176_g10763 [Lecanicillium fungicola]
MPSTNVPGIPRVSSSLSHVSYPSSHANPHVGMPRAYSSNSIHYPYGHGRDVVYSLPDASLSQPSSWKGKDITRHSLAVYDVSPGSSTAVSKGPTPEGSSRASNSSHDELEIATTPPSEHKANQLLQVPQVLPQQVQQLQAYHQVQQVQQAQQLQSVQQAQHFQNQAIAQAITVQPVLAPVIAQQSQPVQQVQDAPRPESSHAHRLHPSHRRNSSESSDRTNVPVQKSSSRDSRPPTSMRGFNHIPSLANQQQPGAAPLQESNGGMRRSNSLQHPGMGYSGFTSKPASISPVAPPAARSPSEFNFGPLSTAASGPDPSVGVAVQPTVKQPQHRPRTMDSYATRGQQHPEMEPIVSAYPRHDRSNMPPPLAHENLVNVFPEPVPDVQQGKSGRGKLTKGKRMRWSFSKSSPIAA